MHAEFSHRSLHGHPKGRRRLFIATLLIIILVAADLLSGGMLRGYIRSMASSAWTATAAARSSVTSNGYFSSHRSLARENAALRAQLAEYQERAAAYAVVNSENETLRNMLRIAETDEGITAPIVSSVRASPYGTFLIGAGIGDVQRGALVVTLGGFVVGQVTDVSQRTALVSAIFAADVVTDARINGNLVAVVGRGAGNASTQIPRGVAVQVGDPVIAPGLGNRPIGTVGRIESDPASADQTVYIQLPVNLSSVSFVYVIR